MKQENLYAYYYNLAFQYEIPVSVVLELTTQCNVNCIHCYLPEHKSQGLSFDTVIRLVDELYDVGVSHILLTGGEIFMREDILEIIKYIRKYHIRVTLLSNGTLLDEKIIHELSSLHITEFSTTLFSLHKNIHDKITQMQGSLERLLINLALLKEYKIRVKIKMPIIQTNKECLTEVKNYCDANNFEFYPSTIIFPQNNGNQKPVHLRLSDRDLVKVVKEIDQLNDFKESPVHKRNVPCAAIFYSFAIDCHGDVFPCNSFLYKVGNIYENSIKNIWYNSEALNNIKKIRNSDLQECINCEKKVFCERCPGMALLENKSFLGCDSFAKSVAEIRGSQYLT